MLLVTVVAQFTAKTIISEKAIYFLSLMSCSMNKVSYVIHMQKFYVFQSYVENFFLLKEMVGRGRGTSTPPTTHRPFSTALNPTFLNDWIYFSRSFFLILKHCKKFWCKVISTNFFAHFKNTNIKSRNHSSSTFFFFFFCILYNNMTIFLHFLYHSTASTLHFTFFITLHFKQRL